MSEQASNSMFNCTASPWRDPYKTVDSNQYTDVFRAGLKDHLTQLKNEAVVYSKEEYNALGTFPLCLVRDVGSCRKGLVSEAHIPEDEMILEYKVCFHACTCTLYIVCKYTCTCTCISIHVNV